MNVEQRAAVDEITQRASAATVLKGLTWDEAQSVLDVACEDRKSLLSIIAAQQAEVAKHKCPIGLDDSPLLCSAGTCAACKRMMLEHGRDEDAKTIAALRGELATLKSLIESAGGEHGAGFDWTMLGRIDDLESALAAARAELVETRKEREFLKTEFESAQEKIARSYGYASAPFAAGESVNGKTIRDVTPGSGVVEFIYRDQCQSGWKVKLVGGEHAWDSLWFTRAAVLAAVKQGG